MHVCMYVCTYVCMCVRTYVRTCVRMYVCNGCMYMYVCVRVCMYAYTLKCYTYLCYEKFWYHYRCWVLKSARLYLKVLECFLEWLLNPWNSGMASRMASQSLEWPLFLEWLFKWLLNPYMEWLLNPCPRPHIHACAHAGDSGCRIFRWWRHVTCREKVSTFFCIEPTRFARFAQPG